jgi:predicted membrane GTPase involved in stress response
MISYMEDDEVIEVTPKAIRLHKARAFVATTRRARKP